MIREGPMSDMNQSIQDESYIKTCAMRGENYGTIDTNGIGQGGGWSV